MHSGSRFAAISAGERERERGFRDEARTHQDLRGKRCPPICYTRYDLTEDSSIKSTWQNHDQACANHRHHRGDRLDSNKTKTEDSQENMPRATNRRLAHKENKMPGVILSVDRIIILDHTFAVDVDLRFSQGSNSRFSRRCCFFRWRDHRHRGPRHGLLRVLDVQQTESAKSQSIQVC